jgi:hypothetical protein
MPSVNISVFDINQLTTSDVSNSVIFIRYGPSKDKLCLNTSIVFVTDTIVPYPHQSIIPNLKCRIVKEKSSSKEIDEFQKVCNKIDEYMKQEIKKKWNISDDIDMDKIYTPILKTKKDDSNEQYITISASYRSSINDDFNTREPCFVMKDPFDLQKQSKLPYNNLNGLKGKNIQIEITVSKTWYMLNDGVPTCGVKLSIDYINQFFSNIRCS